MRFRDWLYIRNSIKRLPLHVEVIHTEGGTNGKVSSNMLLAGDNNTVKISDDNGEKGEEESDNPNS